MQAQVTDDMKLVNVNKFVNGLESPVELQYIQQQMEILLAMPKYQAQGSTILPNWKEIVRPWFVSGSQGIMFLDKRDYKTPPQVFSALAIRNAPKAKEYSTAFYDVVQAVSVFENLDKHQISIEKYCDDFVSRIHESLLETMLKSVDLTNSQFVRDNTNTSNFQVAMVALSNELKNQVIANTTQVQELMASKLAAEIGMGIIAHDPNLFAHFDVKKPNACSLPEIVDTMQVKYLGADSSTGRPQKLIRLCNGKPGNVHTTTEQELERLARKRTEKSNNNNLVPPQIQNNNNNQGPIQPSSGSAGTGGGSSGGGTRGGPRGGATPSARTGGGARGSQTPNLISPVAALQADRGVAVPCPLCTAHVDPIKRGRAIFHTYEQCYDHPQLGAANKQRKPPKFKYGNQYPSKKG
jgi:hypothetical protein